MQKLINSEDIPHTYNMDREGVGRRALLAKGLVISSALAGCSSTGNTETPTTDAAQSPTATATTTATSTETPSKPTLEEFTYPEGATQEGITDGILYDTHRAAMIDQGAATVEIDRDTNRPNMTRSVTQTNIYTSSGLKSTYETSGLSETRWSPSDGDSTYVRMDTGFEQRYRVENDAVRPQTILGLSLVESITRGVEWSSAKAVTEVGDEYAATYESTGVANEQQLMNALFGDSLSDVTATIAVSSAGYIKRITYEMTVERDQRTVERHSTITVDEVGEATVSEPSWLSTAQEEGVRFEPSTTDDGRFAKLEMVNGAEIPAQAEVSVSGNGSAFGEVGDAVSEGDVLYLGISESGELLSGVNSRPDSGTALGEFVFVDLRINQFMLFSEEI